MLFPLARPEPAGVAEGEIDTMLLFAMMFLLALHCFALGLGWERLRWRRWLRHPSARPYD
jgi:hypothetical protein